MNSVINGNLVKLDKPQLILKKDGDKMVVQAIVTHKIVFSKRPSPIDRTKNQSSAKRMKLE